MNLLSKKERNEVFENIEGFYRNTTVFDYYKPSDTVQKLEVYNWMNLRYVDPAGNFALYKCIQIVRKEDYESVLNLATNTPLDPPDRLFRYGIQGGVAKYNHTVGTFNLNLMDYDDKSDWCYEGINEKLFHGITKEYSLNSDLQNDGYFFGGNVGGSSLKKMKRPIKEFRNSNFNDLYENLYSKAYPENQN
jgi:hypothetical protein